MNSAPAPDVTAGKREAADQEDPQARHLPHREPEAERLRAAMLAFQDDLRSQAHAKGESLRRRRSEA